MLDEVACLFTDELKKPDIRKKLCPAFSRKHFTEALSSLAKLR